MGWPGCPLRFKDTPTAVNPALNQPGFTKAAGTFAAEPYFSVTDDPTMVWCQDFGRLCNSPE